MEAHSNSPDGARTMRKIAVLFLLLVPVCAFAQTQEIDQLKLDLELLKRLNAEYAERIVEMEKRLIALESADDPAIAVLAEDLDERSRPEKIVAGAEGETAQKVFSTGFDPGMFSYYGYMRAGYGVDENGTKQGKFRAPGAGAAYRLGNENDTYVETGFSWYYVKEKDINTPVFGTHAMVAYSSLEKHTGVELTGDSGAVSLREAYATVRNLDPGQRRMTFWAGQRYYRTHDVHVNDFFWLDMSGYGGGFENYDAGFATISMAWIGGTKDVFSGRNDYIGDLENTDKNNFDLRLNDIELGIGRGNVWLNYSKYRLAATELDLTDENGWATGFWLESDIGENVTNTAVVQYGTGVAANFNSFSPSLRTSIEGDFPEGTDVSKQRRFRVLDVVDFTMGNRWSAQAVVIYQHDDLGLAENTDVKWYSIGFRPVYSFSELYNLALEAGYDYTELETGEEGGLLKLTAAGEITPDVGFFSRPALRFFLTYAKWSDEFRGLIGGYQHREDTSGLSVGVQFESWW